MNGIRGEEYSLAILGRSRVGRRSRKRVKESNILSVFPGQNNKHVGRNRGHINNAIPQVHYQVAIHLISDIFNLEHIRACMSAPEPHGKLLVGEAEYQPPA